MGFARRHYIDVWAIHRGAHDRWEIDWEMPDGHPTTGEVAAAIDADPRIAQYRADLVLSTTAGRRPGGRAGCWNRAPR